MSKVYKLRTIKDVFDTVPADKIEHCLSDMAKAMKYAKAVNALFETAQAGAAGEWAEECEWIDDGKHNLTFHYCAEIGAEPLATIEVKGKDEQGD